MMEILIYFIVGFTGISAGVLVAGGLFALLTKVGVITRMIAFSKTEKAIPLYSAIIAAGGIWGNLISVFDLKLLAGVIPLGIFGVMSGVFTGALSIALAESINVFPVLFKKTKIHRGISWIMFAFAVGKLIGAYLQMV